MKIEWLNSELLLTDNKPLRLTGARGIRVLCVQGTVWITTSGQSEDIFLHEGQWHEIERSALTLVESIGRALIRFERPAVTQPVSRGWLRLGNRLINGTRETAKQISQTGRAASGRDFPA